MSGKNTGKILSLIFVRKSKDKETFSAPDFLTLYYRSSPFEMSSIYEAANRNRNFSILLDPRHVRTADAEPGSDLFLCVFCFSAKAIPEKKHLFFLLF